MDLEVYKEDEEDSQEERELREEMKDMFGVPMQDEDEADADEADVEENLQGELEGGG